MKQVLFITNYAAPYRVRFFDELGKNMDVTVLFSDRVEEQKNRSAQWFENGEGGFRQIQLTRRAGSFLGENLCLDVLDWLRKPFDKIVLCGYSSPTTMLAMAYLRLKKIPFFIEVDGGLIREESHLKHAFKKLLVGSASHWIGSGHYTKRYLIHYGAQEDKISSYPFSSLQEKDIQDRILSVQEKSRLRSELGIREEKMVLAIGQFIPRKGFDILLQAASELQPDVGIYIIGGEPGQEYLELQQKLGLNNVHFLGFQKKQDLAQYYMAADLFVLPTREDIWGLVINEAMAYGLPVITTDKCVAGLELVEEGVNGHLVPVEDPHILAQKMNTVLSGDFRRMGEASLEKIKPYTIENMVKVHMEIFDQY